VSENIYSINNARRERETLLLLKLTFNVQRQRTAAESGLAFTFTEGVLVKAIKSGAWMLLDEINLASSETLQRLFGLLDGVDGTVTITEVSERARRQQQQRDEKTHHITLTNIITMQRGDLDAVIRHPDFRLFAAMNPATDHGKKDLPISMRSRFTEIYVGEVSQRSERALRKTRNICEPQTRAIQKDSLGVN